MVYNNIAYTNTHHNSDRLHDTYHINALCYLCMIQCTCILIQVCDQAYIVLSNILHTYSDGALLWVDSPLA